MTWRAVKIVTKDNLRVVVPNTQLAMEHIINYDQPQPMWRSNFRITLGYEVGPDQVKKMLAATVQQIAESANLPGAPEARIVGYSERGLDWELRFWLPDYASSSEVGQAVQEAFLQHLRFAGIRVPQPREEVFLGSVEDERLRLSESGKNWIDNIELFSGLTDADRSRLQETARTLRVPAGTEIVRQGEPGSSMFVVREGALEVSLEVNPGSTESAGALGPGAVFGELSLLTGSPRSATVRASTPVMIYEITKSDLRPLLQERPELAERLSLVMAERQLADTNRQERVGEDVDLARDSLVTNLLGRARHFFKLGRERPDPGH